MSLNECVKCWDDPCSCGWEYKHLSIESLEGLIKQRTLPFQMVLEYKKAHPDVQLSSSTFSERDSDKDFYKYSCKRRTELEESETVEHEE